MISSLDLDGILSNSHRAIAEFNQYNPDLPTSYVMLASRPSEIEIIDESMVNTDAVSNAVLMATNKIVYVGSMGGLESKSLLAPLLREAMKANLTSCHQCKSPLVVFGAGWDNSQEFKHIWGGLLPHAPGALSRVYDVAFAVIGMMFYHCAFFKFKYILKFFPYSSVLGATMDDQRDYGMVNNRVFEVMFLHLFLYSSVTSHIALIFYFRSIFPPVCFLLTRSWQVVHYLYLNTLMN